MTDSRFSDAPQRLEELTAVLAQMAANLAHLIKADLRMPSRSRCGVRRVVVAGACISAAGSSVSVSAAA